MKILTKKEIEVLLDTICDYKTNMIKDGNKIIPQWTITEIPEELELEVSEK